MYESGNISIEEFNLLWVFELCVAHTRHIDNSIDTLNYKMYGVYVQCSMLHLFIIVCTPFRYLYCSMYFVYFTLYTKIYLNIIIFMYKAHPER